MGELEHPGSPFRERERLRERHATRDWTQG
jgi:hypothetical protein